MNGENLGGTTQEFTTADGCVGIAPTSSEHVPADVLEKTAAIEEKIISGEIVPPYNQETFDEFIANLNA